MADRLEIPGTSLPSEVDKHPVDGATSIRHVQPRAKKHNVKFFVNDEESQVPSDSEDVTSTQPGLDEWTRKKDAAAILAHNKANRHADRVRKHNSAPSSRRNSTDDLTTISGSNTPPKPLKGLDIASSLFDRLSEGYSEKKPPVESDDSDDDDDSISRLKQQMNEKQVGSKEEPHKSQSSNTLQQNQLLSVFDAAGRLENGSGARSGFATPLEDQMSEDYVPRPEQYKPSYLRQLLNAYEVNLNTLSGDGAQQSSEQDDYFFSKLKAYERPETDPRKNQPDFFQNRYRMPASPGSHSGTLTPSDATLVGSSGKLTPNKRPKWYKEAEHWHYNPQADEFRRPSQMRSVGKLLESTFSTASAPATPTTTKLNRPSTSRRSSANSVIDMVKHPVSSVLKLNSSHSLRKEAEKRREEFLRLANDRVVCQDYIVRICRALMAFGAPTHRLEESLQMASRKLGIAASFQYFPSVMICSFTDPVMHISEVRLVKEPTAVNLGKLQDIQEIYKNVIHSQTCVAEAIEQIKFVTEQKPRYSPYLVVFFYGLAAISVGPWAFSARPVDFGIAFVLGCTLGIIQVFCVRSPSFSFISEVFGTFAISFLARAFGSIPSPSGGQLFCMPALQNSAIALILPGWIILSAALELQSRNLLSGSIRLVYAIFYTLILAFGTIFGLMTFGFVYSDATNDLQCVVPDYWRLTKKTDIKFLYINLPFVLAFTLCLAIVNQAKPKQLPWMLGISWIGYCANYFASMKFIYTPIANMISAFAIGMASHLYSRLFHGVAAAVMLPAIFVLVPSGLAASGGLSAGLTVANDQRFNTTTSAASATAYSGTIFDVASSMIQLAIGLSVGLFVSALCMYPFGKKRSGIFSF